MFSESIKGFFGGWVWSMNDNLNMVSWPGCHLDTYSCPKWNLGGLSLLDKNG